jgi:hypothetical protein
MQYYIMNSQLSEILANYRDFKRIIDSHTFDDLQHPLFNSALVHTLILARDMLFKSERIASKRVRFTDDVAIDKKISDVTDLIIYYRNVACHAESPEYFDNRTNIRFSFVVVKGKNDCEIAGGKKISADYDDDICILVSDKKLYLQRHLLRAYNEAVQNLRDLVPQLDLLTLQVTAGSNPLF